MGHEARQNTREVEIVVGPPAVGKSRYVLEHYRRCVAECGHDAALFLVPTQRVADTVRGRLVAGELEGLFDFRVMTFIEAANMLLVANHAPVSLISDVQRLTVLRLVLDQMAAEELGPLGEHVHRPGLVAALIEDIDEFKAAGITPEELGAAMEAAGASEQERAVARVYQRYQETLQRLGLFDRPGTLWAALEQLEAGRSRPFDGLRLVVADGFSDFTTVQVRMLARLADVAGRCIVTLTMVAEDDRAELLGIPRRTLRVLRGAFGGRVQVRRLEGAREPASDREWVLRGLFDPATGPRERGGEGEADGTVQIMEAPGVWAEVRMVAREIKRLLTGGDGGERVSPADVAIIARALDPYEDALREIFDEYGLPLFVARGRRLAASPVARAVLGVLEVVVADYPREEALELWRSSYLDLRAVAGGKKQWATAEEADEVTRLAGVVGGRERWVRAIERLEERTRRRLERLTSRKEADEEDEYEDPDHLRRILEVAPRVRATFGALVELLEPLREPGPRAAMVERFLGVLERLGIQRRIVRRGAEFTAADLRAWNGIVASLQGMLDVDEYLRARELGSREAQVTVEEFADEVRQLLADSRIHPEGRGEGRVVAMAVGDALQTSYDYVFVIGLTEGMFPAARSPDPLVPDECRRKLAEAGLPVRMRQAPEDEEAYLFHLTLSTARRRLYVVYPTADARGEPLLRSLYVDEVERLVPDAPVKRLRLRDVVPPLWEAASGRELVERTVWLEHHGTDAPDRPLWAAAVQTLARSGRWSAALEAARLGGRVELVRDGHGAEGGAAPLGGFDAVLTDPAARALVAERFGDRHIFSARQLGEYGTCPMSFFFARVLGLEPLEEPGEDLTALDIGLLMHSILRRFYERRVEEGLGHVAQDQAEDPELRTAEQTMATVAEEVFAEYERSGLTANESLWEVTQRLIEARLRAWLKAEVKIPRVLELAETPRPRFFECRYDPRQHTELTVKTGPVGPVVFRGRIDRIDEVGSDGFVVYDYKLGRGAEVRDMLEGADFQLVLYALAGERVIYKGGRRCVGWTYVRVGYPPNRHKGLFGTVAGAGDVAQIVDIAVELIGLHVEAMRRGRFHWPESCQRRRYCPFASICRFEPRRVRRRLMGGGEGW